MCDRGCNVETSNAQTGEQGGISAIFWVGRFVKSSDESSFGKDCLDVFIETSNLHNQLGFRPENERIAGGANDNSGRLSEKHTLLNLSFNGLNDSDVLYT